LTTAPTQLRGHTGGDLRPGIADRLAAVRRRTLDLIAPLSEETLGLVHDPLMSPIVWDLGHMATFEDLWLVQNAFGKPPLREELGRVYDPFSAARAQRGQLPFLRSEDCFAYMEAVRARTLQCLANADLDPEADKLLANGFVYEMIIRHELQHTETILQTLQLAGIERPSFPLGGQTGSTEAMMLVSAGEFEMGTDLLVFSYDNERPSHSLHLGAFEIDSGL